MTDTISKPTKQKLRPKFTIEGRGMWNAIKTIEHPFLQMLIDAEALVVFMGEFTVFGLDSSAIFYLYDDHVELECISTPEELRGKGSATKLMKAFCEAADETNTTIKLRTANVTGNGWNIMQHMVIAIGMQKKNKIPTAKLPKWYESFGFVKLEKAMRNGKSTGWYMERKPQTKS